MDNLTWQSSSYASKERWSREASVNGLWESRVYMHIEMSSFSFMGWMSSWREFMGDFEQNQRKIIAHRAEPLFSLAKIFLVILIYRYILAISDPTWLVYDLRNRMLVHLNRKQTRRSGSLNMQIWMIDTWLLVSRPLNQFIVCYVVSLRPFLWCRFD